MISLESVLFALTLLAALGCGLMAGVFFAFSAFVMRALARLPASEGIAAMQSVNATVINPLFLGVFFGTAALCVLAVIAALFRWQEPGAVYLLIGGALYLAGTFAVTIVFNVPRNNALAAVTPADPEAANLWAGYLAEWTAWNHVRTLAALAAAALLALALGHLSGATAASTSEAAATAGWLDQLESWREFYLLVGTAGATLLALMFVVVTLGPHVIAAQASTGVRAFFTPIIVVFTSALVVSGLMMTYGVTARALGALLALIGLAGVLYAATTGAHAQWRMHNMLRIDWVWFVGLPVASYAVLALAGVGIWMQASFGVYAVEAAVLLMLVVGIRNSWDVVLWIASQPRG